MGAIFSSLFARLFGKQNYKVLMVGLDSAGKTTILYKLHLGEIVTTIPTIGFNVETVDYKNISFTIWDVRGGCTIQRSTWRHYFDDGLSIIFVVDSADRERLDEAAEALETLLSELHLQGSEEFAILVLANKQDLSNAMDVWEMEKILKPQNLYCGRWHVQGASATKGVGLYEGLDWLTEQLSKKSNG